MNRITKFIKSYYLILIAGAIFIGALLFVINSYSSQDEIVNLSQENPIEQEDTIIKEILKQQEEARQNQEASQNGGSSNQSPEASSQNGSSNQSLGDPQNGAGAEASQTSDEIYLPSVYFARDIAKFDERQNCWLVFSSEIYDVSTWEYPGQSDISLACGETNNLAQNMFELDNQDKPPKEYFKGVYVVGLQ